LIRVVSSVALVMSERKKKSRSMKQDFL